MAKTQSGKTKWQESVKQRLTHKGGQRNKNNKFTIDNCDSQEKKNYREQKRRHTGGSIGEPEMKG